MKVIDWVSFLSFVASGGLATLLAAVGGAFPSQTQKIVAVGAIITALAGVLVRLFANPTGAPATAVVQDAPVVSPTGVQVGTNVSTSSTLPISAPQKGN